jgi:hypothetical protein
MKISAEGKTKIYPQEKINAIRLNVIIPINNISAALHDLKLKIVLLYSNGEDTLNGTFEELESKMLVEFRDQL